MTERSDWWLERVALGEIAGVSQDDLTEEERRRVELLRASNEEILHRYPPQGVRIEVERRFRTASASASGVKSFGKWWGYALVPTAVAAGLVLVMSPEPSERMKGDVRLVIHKKVEDVIEPVRSKAVLSEGDLLQVSYTPGAQGFGMVLSIDGRGAVTLHWPKNPSAASPVVKTKGASLPSAYELDDAPDFERFFLVTCPERFWVRDVVQAAETLVKEGAETGVLSVPDDCRTDTLMVKKVEP